MMKLILVFGTFDVLHPGHLFFLKQAKKKGDKLIASVARDSFVTSMKKKPPLHNEQERMGHLLGSGLVDEVYLSDAVPGTYQLILTKRPQLICLGYDQLQLKAHLTNWLKAHELFIPIEIIPSFEPDKYKSSKLKQELYVAVDIKTTGPSPEQDQLVEIGAVLFNREKELGSFHAFIEPEPSLTAGVPIEPGRGEKRAALLQPLTEVLPAFVRFCRQAYPVTRHAYFTCGFLLYHLSRLRIDTLHLANLCFTIEQFAEKNTPLKIAGATEAPVRNIQLESNLLHTALDDAYAYQKTFCRHLTNVQDPTFIQALYSHGFITTADGVALSFNWQAILRHMYLPLLEESLFEQKPLSINYLQNENFTSFFIQPLGISLEQARLVVLACQKGLNEEKIMPFYLNRIKALL